jgi:fructose/tagatose bisphosphate aldolase
MSLKDYKGVLTGDQVQELFEAAKEHQFALPAVNVIGTNTINAVMETAKAVNSLLLSSYQMAARSFMRVNRLIIQNYRRAF